MDRANRNAILTSYGIAAAFAALGWLLGGSNPLIFAMALLGGAVGEGKRERDRLDMEIRRLQERVLACEDEKASIQWVDKIAGDLEFETRDRLHDVERLERQHG